MFESEFILQPTVRFPSCHAANLAVLADGALAMVCFRGSREGASDTVNTLTILAPGAAAGAWGEERVVVDESGHPSGNAVLMPVPDGQAILFYTLAYGEKEPWSHSLVFFRFTEDGGATFGPARALTEEFGYIVRNPGLVLFSGAWLLPIYDNRGGGKPECAGMGGNEGCVAISTDGGDHWMRYGRMVAGPGLAQPAVVELSAGRLLAYLRTRNHWNGYDPSWAWIYRSESTDGGHNWSLPVPTGVPNNNSGIALLRLRSGALVLAYNHQASRERSPLNLALSLDEGRTWATGRVLEPYDPSSRAGYCYPALAQTPDGLIHCAYTYRRTHIKHVVFDEAWLRAGEPLGLAG